MKYEELSPEAQEKALNKIREWQEFEPEYIIDFVKEAGAALGIRVDGIDYSIGGNGDYAYVKGLYVYKPGWRKALKEVSGDSELLRIGQELQEVQRRHFYQLYSYLTGGVEFDTRCDTSRNFDAEALEDVLLKFNHWAQDRLTAEWEYTYSEENAAYTIEANQYEFDEDGNIL